MKRYSASITQKWVKPVIHFLAFFGETAPDCAKVTLGGFARIFLILSTRIRLIRQSAVYLFLLLHHQNRRSITPPPIAAGIIRPAGDGGRLLIARRPDQDRVLHLRAGDRRVPRQHHALAHLILAAGQSQYSPRLVGAAGPP